jgi:hypothetical protein
MQSKHLWLAVVIVMTASSAQAQHFLPSPYRGAADAVLKREAQRRAERESQNQAYVPPPPPAPNSTRLPRDNKLDYHHVTPGYPLPMTSGNGCGGIGMVAVTEAERIAGETLANTRPTDLERDYPLRTFRDRLKQRMDDLYSQYMRARYITPSALAYDPRDLFVPDTEKLGEEKIRECLPTMSKLIDSYRGKQEELKQAKAEAARQAALPHNRVINAYSLYARVAFCNEVREGYMLQYVNDPEFYRAKIAIKAIVAAALKEDPSLNTDDLWNKDRQAAGGFHASQSYCQLALNQLLNASPVNPYSIQKP